MIYAIADVHGRLDLLIKAIEEIAADAGKNDPNGEHKIVIMGDFVDRGPDSAKIIEMLMASPPDVIVLQGNHEAMMIEVLENMNGHMLNWWVGNGGGQTLASYGYRNGDKIVPPFKVPQEHIDWLKALPLTYETEDHIFVHAGVPHDEDVSEASAKHLQWMLYGKHDEYDDAITGKDQPHKSGKHIVHGHEQSATHPLFRPHRTNLDTFAWRTGRLAIGVFDPDKKGGPVKILWADGEEGGY